MQQYQHVDLQYSESGSFEVPDPGSYIIEFLGVVGTKEWPKTTKEGDAIYDEDGNQVMETSLTLQFKVSDPEDDFDGVEFRDYFPMRVTSKNKSGKLWAALWGVPVTELPLPLPKISEFQGRKAQANLGHREASNGNTYAKIESVVPLKKKKARLVVQDDEDGEEF